MRYLINLIGLAILFWSSLMLTITNAIAQSSCDGAYPDICIASPPPDLDCKDIVERNFKVLVPDPHHLDGDKDSIGCER